ncbi:MAG: TldD/PmbA family protein [Deltaproteobacteria bacterium]|uniref:TldD/PmbA family protein n=1 Tax=Candidatus Zymogenus saltonus TaxID=2844893 RepID=A0A9D8KG31_9DELT|nr:TldD/PmbA family protein [Candidatus Zymogenus saltonus]
MNHGRNFNEISERIFALLKKKGVAESEVYYRASKLLTISSEGGEVEDFRFSEPYGVSLRVIVNGGMGFSFSTHPDNGALADMVDDAISSAKNSTPDEHYALSAPSPVPDAGLIFDDSIEGVPIEEKVERAREVEAGALSVDKRVKRVRSAQYSEALSRVFLRNSNGVDVGYKKSYVTAQLMAVAQENGDQEMGWDVDSSIKYADLAPREVGRGAGIKAVSMLGAKRAPTGRFTALLTREVVSDLLDVLAPSFLGENVLKGKSIFKGKGGKKIISSELTIVDDGLLPGGIGTFPVDGEGVPQRRNSLVAKGVVEGFLYDLLNAGRAGVDPTGSSVRGGVTAPPSSGVNNFYIVPGVEDADSLLKRAGRGIIISELMGVHTANPVTGEFSVGASGFIFEDGRRSQPFKEAAVSGDLMGLFSKIAAVGSDLKFFGNIGAPSLLISEVELSGE